MKYKLVGLGIVFLLYWMGCCPPACRGAVVWSDDFNDGNYDGWTICENSAINNGSIWSATNNYLYLEQDTWSSFFELNWGVISHPSEVAYGTWSFDFKANESEVETGIFVGFEFISNNITNLVSIYDWNCYWVYIDAVSISEFTIKLRKNLLTVFAEQNVPLAGWHHIDVTRTTDGLISVYHNGCPIMEVVDTDIGTSEMVVISGQKGIMIDNIVVDDDVLALSCPPPPFILIGAGVAVVAIVIVLVVILIRRRRS